MPYADITITDIASAANVSRKSYYRNYSSKEAVLAAYLETITEKHLASLPPIDTDRTLADITVTFLEHMKKQDELARLLYKNDLFYLLEEHICNAFLKRYQNAFPDETICFLSGACFRLYLCWFESDYKTPAPELTKNIIHFLDRSIHWSDSRLNMNEWLNDWQTAPSEIDRFQRGRLCKSFLCGTQLKICGAINKEIGVCIFKLVQNF